MKGWIMDDWVEKRMWKNFLKGIACLVTGALAILAVEYLWHQGVFGDESGKQTMRSSDGIGGQRGDDFAPLDLAAVVFDEEDVSIGLDGVTRHFAEECFDPQGLGEVRRSYDGGVVGVVSELEASDLFRACTEKLIANGWVRTSGGQNFRCSFTKPHGAVRWAFLDVTEVSGSGVAVIVVEEVRDDDQAA